MKRSDQQRLRAILEKVKPLAGEFYELTGRPLGVTGEVAELSAAQLLKLNIVEARTEGYDALRGTEKIQIKGRALPQNPKPGQRIGTIKRNADCDTVMVVILDNRTLATREIWEAPYRRVIEALDATPSKARARGALGLTTFKSVARKHGRQSYP